MKDKIKRNLKKMGVLRLSGSQNFIILELKNGAILHVKKGAKNAKN